MFTLMVCCSLCGEILTAPVFIGGKPYGFSCAGKLKLGVSKPNKSDNYVLSDSHNFTGIPGRVTASYQNKKYALLVVETVKNGIEGFYSIPSNGFQIDTENNRVYINLAVFKKV